jgi:cytochrome P450
MRDGQFEPASPAFIEDPYPHLDTLRETSAFCYHQRLDRYLVSRHADVRACLRDRRLGRNFRHVGTDAEFKSRPLDPRWQAFWDVERWSLLFVEPPEHTRIRRLVASASTPRAVEAMREPAEQLADALLDLCLERGRFDLLYDFAQPYSIVLICRLLGVPTDRHRDLLDWSHRHVKMYEFGTTEAQAESATEAAAEFREFVLELIAERRRASSDDLLTGLVETRVDGERLSDDEIVSTIVVLLNAGHEATVNTLGNGVTGLLRHRAEWQRLVRGEASAAAAVEELIRWDAPLQLFERWVLEEGVEIAGTAVPRGKVIAMLFGAANRDPRVFREPGRLDVGRPNASSHIGFGGGIHVCIGAPLARIELEAALRALVTRAPRLELAAEPERIPAFVIRGFRAVEVVVS